MASYHSHDAPIYGELRKKLKSDFAKDSWVNHRQGAGPVTDGSDQACIGSVKMHSAYTATDAALYGHFHRYFDDLVENGKCRHVEHRR